MDKTGLIVTNLPEMIKDENGCLIPKLKPTKDGYCLLHYTRRKEGIDTRIVLHRYMYEQRYGKIPEGYDVHHKCHNRACCNVEHLELIKHAEHAIYHNRTRYKERKLKAYEYFKGHKEVTGRELGSLFSVSKSSGKNWIKQWKMEEKEKEMCSPVVTDMPLDSPVKCESCGASSFSYDPVTRRYKCNYCDSLQKEALTDSKRNSTKHSNK